MTLFEKEYKRLMGEGSEDYLLGTVDTSHQPSWRPSPSDASKKGGSGNSYRDELQVELDKLIALKNAVESYIKQNPKVSDYQIIDQFNLKRYTRGYADKESGHLDISPLDILTDKINYLRQQIKKTIRPTSVDNGESK